jgi:NAD-dependent DNA ligase
MSITKEQLDEIIAKYNRGEPTGYSDEEYDKLLEEYLNKHGGESSRPFNRQKQSLSVNDLVGTLPKVYGVTEPMRPNQKTYSDWIVARRIPENRGVCIQPKFDGCSVACDVTMGSFFTRGDYDNGESVDVTDLFKDRLSWIREVVVRDWIPSDQNWPKGFAVKFEAIMDHETFNEFKLYQRYKRPRDVVAAIISSRNVEMAKLITLVPLRVYTSPGRHYIPEILRDYCSTVQTSNCYNAIETFRDRILADGATIKYFDKTFSIDGVVVSLLEDGVLYENTIALPAFINPEYEIAIKILYNVKETKLKSIDYQFGKQGRITPVAILEPVMFDNVKVDHVTLSTLQRVVDMTLRHNDTVRIMYNIVPYFLESYHDGDYPIPVPDKCPVCGSKLDYLSYKFVRCSNPNCKGLKLGAIIRHAEKMKMVGLGEGVLTKLFDLDFVNSITELYDIQKWGSAIINTPGFGQVSYDNMVKSVNKALSEATLSRFLGALPFNDTDEKTWKQILMVNEDHYWHLIRSMQDGSFPDWIMSIGYVPGIGTTKIRKMIDGYLRNKEEIQFLMSWVPDKLKHVDYSYGKNGKICMTGTRDADLIEALTSNGWEVGGWSNDCEYVIVPDHNFTSAKTKKAKEKGIPIYTVKEAYDNLIKPF